MSKLNEAWKVEKHGPLTPVAEGIWSAEGSIEMPLGRFPRRMTVIRLVSGTLAVWSAVSLDEAEMTKLDALGPVGFLIVPNAGHRLDLKAWTDRYPDARVVAPQGAAEAVAEVVPIDTSENILGDPSVSFDHVAGTKSDELALIVTRSDGVTLILNDILASVSHPDGFGAKIMAHLFGFGVDHPKTSRLVRHMYVEDAKAVAEQFRRWATIPDLRRVIVSHVDIIDEAPAEALARAADEL